MIFLNKYNNNNNTNNKWVFSNSNFAWIEPYIDIIWTSFLLSILVLVTQNQVTYRREIKVGDRNSK